MPKLRSLEKRIPPQRGYCGSCGMWLRLVIPTKSSCPFSGLLFTQKAITDNLNNPSKELSDSFKESYSRTLAPHHSFLIKPVFTVRFFDAAFALEIIGS